MSSIKTIFTDIANAIRTKLGNSTQLKPTQMADAINNIPTGITPSGTKNLSINVNGTTTENVNTYEFVQVTTNVVPNLQSKTVVPTTSSQSVTADSNFDGLSQVNVQSIPSQYIVPTGTKNVSINQNGTVIEDVEQFADVKITTNVQPNLQSKSFTPTKSTTAITADSGYDGLGTVTVNAIPSQYIIPSGSQTATVNKTYDVTSLAELIVNVASGGGVLPSDISAFDFGDVVVTTAFSTTRQIFNHSLGVTPDLMIVYTPQNVATTYSMLAAIRGNMFGWRSSAYNSHYAYHGNSTTTVTWANSNNTSYGISNMTTTTFQLASSSTSYYWRAGTYKYIAIKFQ